MKFKGDFKKIRFFATIGLSAMAMVVATIGTFAWFQARSSGADPRHEVTAGDAGISISDVKGYKYKYTPRDESTTDYTTGAVAEYDLTNPSSQATNNHQDEAVPITSDVPEGGVGYYVVGNSTFTGSSSTAWLYSGAAKMTTSDAGSYTAALYRVYLTSGTQFNVKHHYYAEVDHETVTKDVTVSASLSGSGGTKENNTTGNVTITTTGTYTIGFTVSSGDSGTITIDKVSTRSDGRIYQRHNKTGPTKKEAAYDSSKTQNIFYKGGHTKIYTYSPETMGGWPGQSLSSHDYGKSIYWGGGGSFGNLIFNTPGGGQTGNLDFDSSTPFYDDNGAIDASGIFWFNSGTENREDLDGEAFSWNNSTHTFTKSKILNANDYFYFSCDKYRTGNIHKKTLSNTTGGNGSPFKSTYRGRWTFELPAYVYATYNDIDYYWATEDTSKYSFHRAYGVTLNKNGGTINDENVTEYFSGEAKTLPSNVTKTGYDFVGWYDNSSFTGSAVTQIASNATGAKQYWAKWTAKSYTITLNDGDGSGGDGSVGVDYNTALPSVTPPTKSGYAFQGYYAAAGGSGKQYFDSSGNGVGTWTETNNRTVYAFYAIETTITFDKRSGSGGSDSVVALNGKAMPSASMPTRTGYAFQGYYDDPTSGTQYYTSGGASARSWNKAVATCTLYAHWSARTYTVTLNNNGATSSGDTSVTATYGADMPSATMPTKTGYIFQGYYFGETQYYTKDGDSARTWNRASATTLTARWEVNLTGATTLYILDDQWFSDTLTLYCWGDGFTYETRITETVGSYANLYSVQLPVFADGFVIHNGTMSGSNQTKDMTINGADSFTSNYEYDPTGSSGPSLFLIEPDTDSGDSSKHKWKWGYRPNALPAKEGHFLCPYNSQTAYTEMQSTRIAGNNKAVLMNAEIASTTAFNIYRKELTAPGASKYNLAHYDNVAGGAESRSFGNPTISTAGSYDIYLNSSSQIYAGSHQGATLEFSSLKGSAASLTMGIGDQSTYNMWVYESVVQVDKDDQFCIKQINGSTTTYKGTGQVSIENNSTDYLENGTTANGVTQYKFKVAGSFTVYWTHSGTLSVAPVPEMGFGYYILLNQGSKAAPVFSYGSCVKMKEVDSNESYTNRAYYYSFYAAENQVIAFRSYVDGVDTYYTNANISYSGTSLSGTTSSSGTAAYAVNSSDNTSASNSAKSHGVVMKTAGYYNFFIYWNSSTSKFEISIVPAETASTFFKLNTIDSSNVASADAIKNQNTAFVLAVKFTANNPYGANIYANAIVSSSCNLRFTALLDTNISGCTSANEVYSTVKDAAYTKNSWSSCTSGTASLGGSLAASSSADHVLYIVIDYTPGTTITSYGGILSFVLKAAQA